MFPAHNFGARLFRGVWLDGGTMDRPFLLTKSTKTGFEFTADTFRNQGFTNFGREWGRYGSPRADIKPERSYELQEGF